MTRPAREYPFWGGLHDKDSNIWGSISGSPIHATYHIDVLQGDAPGLSRRAEAWQTLHAYLPAVGATCEFLETGAIRTPYKS